ncbi:tripartite motif-containing protein 66 [Pelomyxa schiedti]|nr:tripartite motif-containing protein 66 [Pelomyxa schiedti]
MIRGHSEVCWVCYKPIPTKSIGTDSQRLHSQMECGHRVCRSCVLSLCTSAYLSPASPLDSRFSSGSKEDVDGEVNIECRVCHHVTSFCVWEVIADVSVDTCHNDGTCFQPEKCVLHPDRPLERFCVNDNLLVCLECALEHHRTHELVTITRQAQTAAEQVPGIVELINRERALLEDSSQLIERSISTLTEDQRRMELQIKSTFNRLMKALQKKKDTLLANTAKFFETRKRALELQMKCKLSVISQLDESQNSLKTAANNGATKQTSLVAITQNPVLMNHSKAKIPIVLRNLAEPLRDLLGACQGRFHLKQEGVTSTGKCIENLSISIVGDEQLALQTMRLFVEGDFQQAFDNCIEMLPCSSHSPLREIHVNNKPDDVGNVLECHVCSRSKTNIRNQSETFSLMLLYFILSVNPSLFQRLGPFTKPLKDYITRVLLLRCSPESQAFLKTVTESATSLVPQPLPPPPPLPTKPAATTASKAPSNKFWSLFQATPPAAAPQHPLLEDHTSTTVEDWRCGVAALGYVMPGYMFWQGVGGARGDTRAMAIKAFNNSISLCEDNNKPHNKSCLSVPRALAEYFIGWLLRPKRLEHWEVSARLGNLWAQSSLSHQHLRGDICFAGKNAREGVKWLAMASEGGDAWAQYRMATLYETGCAEDGVSKDMAEAMRLYRLSAEQGNEDAQYKLGVFLVDGCATSNSGLVETMRHEEGVRWLSLAARQGNAEAKIKLDGYFIFHDE